MPVAPAPSIRGAKSCDKCPAFLVERNQTSVLGSNLSAPVCGLKMVALVMPSNGPETASRVLGHVAKDCAQFGSDVEFKPLPAEKHPLFFVGMDPLASTVEPDEDQTLASCHSCEHFVTSARVSQQTGWTGPICRAQGALMVEVRLPQYARSCGKFKLLSYGSRPAFDLDSFSFLPIFDAEFGSVNYTQTYVERVSNIIDPAVYPNERELTPRLERMMQRRGIRAWRRVVDPDGYGEDVFLPIYDPNAKITTSTGETVPFLTDDEKELVPRTGDDEHPELYADHNGLLYHMAVLWMKLDETPAWWGQGGTGKTEFARHLAWLMQLPFTRISIHGSTETDDLVGKMMFEENETRFHYGILSSRWTRPGIILLDEPNTGPNEVWQKIRPLTDNSRLLVVTENKNERLKRGPETFFAMAMNPAWDPRNVGTQTLGDADGSRLMHMMFNLPPEPLEREIIQARVRLDGWELDKKTLDNLMKVAKELRAASESGTLHTTWGVRHQLKVARALRWFTPIMAYRRAVGDYMEPAQFDFVLTTVKHLFGG